MDFKDRIKILRVEKSLSYAMLASEFDKSESAIRMWEAGQTKPDANTLIKLSKYFDCSVDYMLGLSELRNYSQIGESENRAKSVFESAFFLPKKVGESLFDALDTLYSIYIYSSRKESICTIVYRIIDLLDPIIGIMNYSSRNVPHKYSESEFVELFSSFSFFEKSIVHEVLLIVDEIRKSIFAGVECDAFDLESYTEFLSEGMRFKSTLEAYRLIDEDNDQNVNNGES